MTSLEIADLLEKIASQVIQLPGVSRIKPHAFAEAKSELRGELLRKAAELRTFSSSSSVPRSPICPGVIIVENREVRVEVKRRAVTPLTRE